MARVLLLNIVEHSELRQYHLFMRDTLATPRGEGLPIVKREPVRCVELRRSMIQARWFT